VFFHHLFPYISKQDIMQTCSFSHLFSYVCHCSLSLFSMSGISCYCTSVFPVCYIIMTCCSQINNFCFQTMGISRFVNMCCLVALLFCCVEF
jgi:hypothetical protein